MAALPSPTQVAGPNNAIYDAYYNVVDPKGLGSVGGMEAARFLKRSGLSDVMLSKIWDLSDPGGRGCLDKAGMFVALKLVALVQNGKDLSIANVNVDVPPPKMGDIPLPKPVKPPPPTNSPLITSLPPTAVDWTVKPSEKDKYDKLFDSLQPKNGLIPGNTVKHVLMESKLPFETLGKIWDLADQDKDGMLDRHEFIIAMHLVYKALEKHAIPNTLPSELMPPTKRPILDGVKPDVPPPPAAIVPPTIPAQPPILPPSVAAVQPITTASVKPIQQQAAPAVSWVVGPEERAKSDTLFIKSDIDKDGFVSGGEIKDVFLQSGVPQPILAHIWFLCDIKQCGKLNNEQFALAMWFVARYLKGIDPPAQLTPEMIPPSFRSVKPSEGLVENNNTRYSNPELDMISKDIEELSREKLALETEIAQKEADIKIKSGEIKNLQSELDTLAATLKQLENQKGEAQKRLNDLKAQRTEVDGALSVVNTELEEQMAKVDKLRIQAAEQAELVAAQEDELNSRKQQLEGLRMEEQRLEQQKLESSKKLENLTGNLQDTQLNISKAKNLISELEEQSRQMNDAIQACDNAIDTGDVISLPDTALRIEPNFRSSKYLDGTTTTTANTVSSTQNGFGEDPFASQNGPTNTGFTSDPFNNDPFKSKDAFSNDPFNDAFSKTTDGFSSDPFGGSFNAFENKNAEFPAQEPEKDPFGCDPFAILHAPTRDGSAPPRPTSPSPALPPKKSKQPPPRPAPPRPAAPPAKRASQGDAFGGGTADPFSASSGGGGGFADFSDFDAKFSNNIPPPVKSTTTPSSGAAPAQNQSRGLDFTDDPFRDYRYEDPFNISFDDEPTTSSNKGDASCWEVKNDKSDKFDPFGLDGRQSVPLPMASQSAATSGRASAPPVSSELMSEDQQLAWAAKESIRLEEDRRKRQLQEQAELELAISLSKAEQKKVQQSQ
ncbi:epidermal growth factor receptor substrate 15-like 1 isoform X3 [Aethina tumida]|uniref:epidermal growth factor receptor substrate 15-like 1 isoform X3 n=1 Tax=Aethina tumida TaxID=116153 RepID=UPI00096B3FDC|nr:epidermal growth factor receptor substrate 15-like 1 isoform X3 [Aethina tumida]